MKKLFLLGFITLTFVSCSKDSLPSQDVPADYKNAAAVVDEYQSNFVNTFGTPSANQTWGFGTPVNVANSMRRANAVIPGDPFTYETTEGYYKTTIPETAKDANEVQDYQLPNLTELKLVNASYSISLERGSRDIYVSGAVTLNVDGSHWINQARILCVAECNAEPEYEFTVLHQQPGDLRCGRWYLELQL